MRSRSAAWRPRSKLVQRAEDLRCEASGDFGLRLPARLEKRRQTPLGRVVVEPKRREQQLQAAEHRPPADLGERADREGEPAARLAARGVDQPEFVVGDEEADRDLLFAQEALEALVRRRLPAFERAALVGLHARGLDADEDLPAAVRVGDRPVRPDLGVALLDLEEQLLRDRPPAGRAGDLGRPPAEQAGEERPRVFQRARVCPLRAAVVRLRRYERLGRTRCRRGSGFPG